MDREQESARVEKATAHIERAEIRKTTGQLADSADRRTELAADRTVYAAERTYAAWVRTGLAALASGVGAKALLTGHVPDLAVRASGVVLTLFSAFCFVAAVWRELLPPVPPPQPDARRLPSGLFFAVNGLLALVALMATAGIAFS